MRQGSTYGPSFGHWHLMRTGGQRGETRRTSLDVTPIPPDRDGSLPAPGRLLEQHQAQHRLHVDDLVPCDEAPDLPQSRRCGARSARQGRPRQASTAGQGPCRVEDHALVAEPGGRVVGAELSDARRTPADLLLAFTARARVPAPLQASSEPAGSSQIHRPITYRYWRIRMTVPGDGCGTRTTDPRCRTTSIATVRPCGSSTRSRSMRKTRPSKIVSCRHGGQSLFTDRPKGTELIGSFRELVPGRSCDGLPLVVAGRTACP